MENLELSWIEVPATLADIAVDLYVKNIVNAGLRQNCKGKIKKVFTYIFEVEYDGETVSWRYNALYFATEFVILLPSASKTLTVETNQIAINDFICKTCSNNRCSKSERACWKCGNLL